MFLDETAATGVASPRLSILPILAPAFNPLNSHPEVTLQVTLARRAASPADPGLTQGTDATGFGEWGRQDSNLEPTDYESAALTD